MSNTALPAQQETLHQAPDRALQGLISSARVGTVRRALLIMLTFLVGAAAGLGGAYVVWRPYGEGSLTHAVLRKCGTRAAPRGEDRCTRLVEDALDIWFTRYYDGDH